MITGWHDVKAPGRFESLAPGAYVAYIQKAEDHPDQNFVEYEFEIVEGPRAGCMADAPDWARTVRRYYVGFDGSPSPSFKADLDAFEASNPGKFTIEAWERTGCACRSLTGLTVGIMVRQRLYTGRDGVDAEGTEIAWFMPVDKVRSGKWTMPKPRDQRANKGAAPAPAPQAVGYADYADCPF